MAEDRYLKTVFDWDHFTTYLAGPIDFADDGGRDWREELTEDLIQLGFHRNRIFSPTNKPIKGTAFNLDNEAEIMQQCRENEDWDGLTDVVDQIAHIDLRLCDHADLILAYFPLDSEGQRIPTYGTIHELVVARQQKKPVFVVWPGGKSTCSGWIMWLVGHDNVFESFNDVLNTLDQISNGEVCVDANDWLLIDYKNERKTNAV